MKKKILLNIAALLSVFCLVVALLLPNLALGLPQAVDSALLEVSETQNTVKIAAAKLDDGIALTNGYETLPTEHTEDELCDRFNTMLSLNYCYGEAFLTEGEMIQCAAISLSDYAADLPGVGLAVNSCLVEGFVKSFYGVELSAEALPCLEEENGFITVPVTDCGSRFFELISVDKTEQGYEVIAKSFTYYGGEDFTEELLRAVFSVDGDSEFGFNLVFAELL